MGVHAGKLFEPSKLLGGTRKLYANAVTTDRNFLGAGVAKRAMLDAWIGSEKLKR